MCLRNLGKWLLAGEEEKMKKHDRASDGRGPTRMEADCSDIERRGFGLSRCKADNGHAGLNRLQHTANPSCCSWNETRSSTTLQRRAGEKAQCRCGGKQTGYELREFQDRLRLRLNSASESSFQLVTLRPLDVPHLAQLYLFSAHISATFPLLFVQDPTRASYRLCSL